MRFTNVVLLLPAVTMLHVAEEWPGFPRWARRFASPRYTDREYLVTHAFTVAGALATAFVVSVWPSPWIVFPFLLLWLGPGVLSNAIFHVGASIASRTYCPGAVTGLLLYLPLSATLVWLALREGIMGPLGVGAALVLAPVLHAAEVGHNVFKRW